MNAEKWHHSEICIAINDGLSERMKKQVWTPLRLKDLEGCCGFRGQQRKQMSGFLTKLE